MVKFRIRVNSGVECRACWSIDEGGGPDSDKCLRGATHRAAEHLAIGAGVDKHATHLRAWPMALRSSITGTPAGNRRTGTGDVAAGSIEEGLVIALMPRAAR